MQELKLLSVPLKVVGDVDLVKPLNTLLKGKNYPPSVSASLTSLQALRTRMVAVIKGAEVSDSALEVMQSYYDQLGCLETKIPFSQAKIYFKWLDAFDKGGWLGGNVAYTMSTSLLYEKACVLFNVAAISTKLAAAQDLGEEDGLRRATQLLQSAAGVFSAMTAPLPADCTEQKPTQDLSPDCLEALSSICLAQAQDCVLRKAVRDQKKAAVVAKLASHAKVLYLQTNLGLGRESVRNMWERDWTTSMEQRASLCRGLAELHQASVCQEQGKWGERIARLRVAKASLAAVPEWLARAETALAEAVKDNDFIYHDRVPDAEQLEPVAPAAVVKATPLPERWRPGEADLFKEMPAWADVKLKPVECVVS